MKHQILIRSETGADVGIIAEVTVAAFNTLVISNHTEQFIISALRAAKALTVSLVAELDGRVVGHVAFSPVTVSDGTQNWFGLGPVSVLPEYQRQGIGKALTLEGLSRLKDLKAQGACLVGHPERTEHPSDDFRAISEIIPEKMNKAALKWYKMGIKRGFRKAADMMLDGKFHLKASTLYGPNEIEFKVRTRFAGKTPNEVTI